MGYKILRERNCSLLRAAQNYFNGLDNVKFKMGMPINKYSKNVNKFKGGE